MMQVAQKIKEYESVKPFQFNVVSRLELVVSLLLQGNTNELVLHLTAPDRVDPRSLRLTFSEIRNLTLRAPGAPFQVFLEICDASDRQWDRVHYQIIDRENERLSFLCNDFTFEIRDSGQ